MTNSEFSVEFDLLYNNIKSQSAPGLDEYEKSVLLTQAQEDYIKGLYSGFNRTTDSFEETESKRRSLDKLIKQVVITPTSGIPSTIKIDTNSVFFELPSNLMYILKENITIGATATCSTPTILDILPIKLDEYNKQKDNPFRKPKLSNKRAWRLENNNAGLRYSEIVAPEGATITNYTVRYLKKPNPIVLADLTEAPYNDEVSIDGITAITECELDSVTHREILKLAVEKAKIFYDMVSSQGQAQAIVEYNRVPV